MKYSTMTRCSMNGIASDTGAQTCSPVSAGTRRKEPHILCVDDDPEISRSIEIRLREYLVSVSRAYFGMQGFWEAITDHPDLIIMDLAMPNGDGKFVLESLRNNSNTQTIPIIVLTGMRDVKIRNHVFALGANQFLTKPTRFDELLHEISRFIDLEKRPELTFED